MLLNSKLGTMAIEVEEKDPEGGDDDGDDGDEEDEVASSNGFYTKKIDILRAWERKQKKLAAKKLKAISQGSSPRHRIKVTPKKLHSSEIDEKILLIKK